MLHIRYPGHYLGIAVTRIADVAQCISFSTYNDYYALLEIKSLSGHIHMYKMENKLMPGQLMLQRNCLWDTVTINWENVQI